MKLVFNHVTDEANNIHTFYFEPEEPLDYTAGQYLELNLPHPNADDRGETRLFTISSSPTDEYVSITTRILSSKSSSFKKALLKLKPGKIVEANAPMGDFVLPKLIQTPLIFVAGGIGVTPYHSILSWLADTKEVRPIKFIYGINSEDDIIFQDTFDRANQHVTLVVKNPTSAWGGERGLLSAELILGLEKPTTDTLIYVSGPEPIVEALEKDLKAAGLKQEQLVLDYFPNYDSI
jgi:ferredoxin-NADP reductase